MKEHIEELIQAALTSLKQQGALTVQWPAIHIDNTKDKKHGDFASNIALMLAKSALRKPRELAELIVAAIPASSSVTRIEIAGAGFINFFLAQNAFYSVIENIIATGEQFGHVNIGQGKPIMIEFVSSNPTGPLHVGHGRHAAYGAVVANLLDAIGYKTHREYYVNDAGRQMDILAASIWLRYLILNGEQIPFPANAYKGDYVTDIAKAFQNKNKETFVVSAENLLKGLPLDETEGGDKEIYIDAVIARAKQELGEEKYLQLLSFSLDNILMDIRDDLAEFGVHFDEWYSERTLAASGVVDRLIDTLKQKGLAYERDDALWFRSTDFDDEKDRVLARSNGQKTYFANDLAYHITKFERGFVNAIDVFGSDHHGYVPRMKAGLRAFDIQPEKLTYLLLQFVSLYRNGQQVQMSTRSGSFVTLRELREEVGNDVARFFYVMRKCEQPIDFDLDLAKSQSNENPVYYIQYAHARICSVFRQLLEKNFCYDEKDAFQHLTLLTEPHEVDLLSTLSRYQNALVNAAKNHEPHILTNYLRDLANDFHTYYNAQQFLVADEHLRNARLSLIKATRQIIANGLRLIGVSAPESM